MIGNFQAVVRYEDLKLSINIKYIQAVLQIELNITQVFSCQGFSPEQLQNMQQVTGGSGREQHLEKSGCRATIYGVL